MYGSVLVIYFRNNNGYRRHNSYIGRVYWLSEFSYLRLLTRLTSRCVYNAWTTPVDCPASYSNSVNMGMFILVTTWILCSWIGIRTNRVKFRGVGKLKCMRESYTKCKHIEQSYENSQYIFATAIYKYVGFWWSILQIEGVSPNTTIAGIFWTYIFYI